MKIEAANRLVASWWDDLAPEEKKAYVEKHPDSKYAEDYDNKHDAEQPADHNDDVARVSELKGQVEELKQDIADIEGDGEDASKERKLLMRLKGELVKLGASVIVEAVPAPPRKYPKEITWRKALALITQTIIDFSKLNITDRVKGTENKFQTTPRLINIDKALEWATTKHGKPDVTEGEQHGHPYVMYTWYKADHKVVVQRFGTCSTCTTYVWVEPH